MAKYALVKGTVSQTIQVFIQDSTSTTGAGKTGLAFNSAGLTAYYLRPRSAAVAITLATQTVTGAYSSGGFVEINAVNAPGWYRLDLPDAVLASGVDHVGVHMNGAAGMAPLPLEIQLTGADLNNATNMGLANLDAAVSTRSTYAGADTAGTTTLLTRVPLALVGGKMDSVVPDTQKVDLNTIKTQAVATTGAGTITIPAAATLASTTNITAGTIATVSGNVNGSVGSVTGAVGSVTAGVTLAASAVQAIWDSLTTALTTIGSIGKLLVDNLNATVASRATPAQVNTEMVDALSVDVYAEPGQGFPSATTTLAQKIGYLFKAWRNRSTQTAADYKLFNDDALTVDQKAATSDDGITFDRGEVTTGP